MVHCGKQPHVRLIPEHVSKLVGWEDWSNRDTQNSRDYQVYSDNRNSSIYLWWEGWKL